MQAAPAVDLHLQRFSIWNGLLISLGASTIALDCAWFAFRNPDLSAWSGGLMLTVLLLALIGLWISLRRHPVRLRWDAQRWYLVEGSLPVDKIAPSRVQVMVDTGVWLLLKFVPEEEASNRGAARWLPVQRRGIEGQWHALRCAVYSPRPALGIPSGLDGRLRIE